MAKRKINFPYSLPKIIVALLCCLFGNSGFAYSQPAKQRIVVIMFDGFGMSYYNASALPNIKALLARNGLFKEVSGLMPSVTNCNNAAICTGTFPAINGITGNTFLTPEGKEEFMESSDLLTAPTLFEKLQKNNLKSALFSSKKKSISLLSKGTEIAQAAEEPSQEWINLIGKPMPIYSPDINYWTIEAGLYVLKNRKDISCVYLHTTDYPMHMWAPSDSNSIKHISKIDAYIGEIARTAPDAVIMITADHDLNHKETCIDIEKYLATQQVSIKIAISAERDKYFKHHRGFGGTSYVYLNKADDYKKVKAALQIIPGVKEVYSREEFASKFNLMPERIGDLNVLGDAVTVFGNLETPSEKLPANYRSHGSESELKVPLIILNAKELPTPDFFNYNKDITRWLK